jgi:hypothetical protein
LRIPKSVEKIGGYCCWECKSLSEVVFEEGSSLKKIGCGVFRESSLKSLWIPKSVEEIGDDCFQECKSLSEVVFEEGSNLKKIGENVFSESGLKHLLLPKSQMDHLSRLLITCLPQETKIIEVNSEETSAPRKKELSEMALDVSDI